MCPALFIDTNDEYEKSFNLQSSEIKLELFHLLHRVVSSSDPTKLEFVHELTGIDEAYLFSTRDGNTFVRSC